jgi:hypothetical protein
MLTRQSGRLVVSPTVEAMASGALDPVSGFSSFNVAWCAGNLDRTRL